MSGRFTSKGSLEVRYVLLDDAVRPFDVTTIEPRGTNRPTIFTASPSRPPPFPLRSITRRFMPFLWRDLAQSLIVWATPSVNFSTRIYPVSSSSMPEYGIEGSTIRSRITGTAITSPASQYSPARSFFTRKSTVVPGLPRIFSLLCELVRPWVDSPSMLTISSPHCRPALEAGEPA